MIKNINHTRSRTQSSSSLALPATLFICILICIVSCNNSGPEKKSFAEGKQFYIETIQDGPAKVNFGDVATIDFNYKNNPKSSIPLQDSFVSVLAFNSIENPQDDTCISIEEKQLHSNINSNSSEIISAELKHGNPDVEGEITVSLYLQANFEDNASISNEVQIPILFVAASEKDKTFAEGRQFYIKAIQDGTFKIKSGVNLNIGFEYIMNPSMSFPNPESFVSVIELICQDIDTKEEYKHSGSLFRNIDGKTSGESFAFLQNDSNLEGEGVVTVYLQSDFENKKLISNELRIPIKFIE